MEAGIYDAYVIVICCFYMSLLYVIVVGYCCMLVLYVIVGMMVNGNVYIRRT